MFLNEAGAKFNNPTPPSRESPLRWPEGMKTQMSITVSWSGEWFQHCNDEWVYFSNYGNPPVDYSAPGVKVTSTLKDGGYNSISGTSMASPHLQGVLLLGNASTDGTVNGSRWHSRSSKFHY